MWSALKNHSDTALLFIRVTLGTLYIWVYGWPKLAGGLPAWKRYALKELAIVFWPGFWGFLAAFAETVGCSLLILGLFFRPSALLLFITVALATFADFLRGGVTSAAPGITISLFFLCLMFVGPGRFSLDKG